MKGEVSTEVEDQADYDGKEYQQRRRRAGRSTSSYSLQVLIVKDVRARRGLRCCWFNRAIHRGLQKVSLESVANACSSLDQAQHVLKG